MSEFYKKHFALNVQSKTDAKFVFIKNSFRFSVLTSRLLRVEHDFTSRFTDEATQVVWYRNFDTPSYRIIEEGSKVKIVTTDTVFTYDLKRKKMESITLKGGKTVTDYKHGNLKGTYRTLDQTFGKIPLEDGLISTDGVAVYDDTKSLILLPDGTIAQRPNKETDEYYFAFGRDYRGAINALYSLCGKVPLVPRYCLGNWWSRYKAYTQEEYTLLMQRFLDEKIPITVATIDMDWHWVDVKRFGADARAEFDSPIPSLSNIVYADGWTGYSWNTDLFPDYKGFLAWLHEKGFKVTLNLHPAQGIRPYEDMYEEFAKRMGEDPKDKKHFKFNITNEKYVESYFDVAHKPHEQDGVDFWWLDWQQGKKSGLKGLDPLWALNHYHYLYSGKDNNRPLILSRYAQIGSHRYPLGFSGDTAINWPCLNFQPYFTANAANVGYTWWSHDIGGHHFGKKDDELYLRWVQFGVFSPIMRLHSTSNEFMGKEPWKFKSEVATLATECLRLRHRLLPYIYTMNYRTHENGIAICEPMYYAYPDESGAYKYKNEYFFGSQLIVAPITEKIDPRTNMAKVRLWLPKGRFTDIFSGRIYEGEGEFTLCRGLESIPVLAKEGAIIPLSTNGYDNDWKNPASLELLIYRGNGEFDLYEDDGETQNYQKGHCCTTKYKVIESGDTLCFTIAPAQGDTSVIPQRRSYTLSFKDVAQCEKVIVRCGEKETVLSSESKSYVSVVINNTPVTVPIEVDLVGYVPAENPDKREALIEAISRFQGSNGAKKKVYGNFIENPTDKVPCDEPYRSVLTEILRLK